MKEGTGPFPFAGVFHMILPQLGKIHMILPQLPVSRDNARNWKTALAFRVALQCLKA